MKKSNRLELSVKAKRLEGTKTAIKIRNFSQIIVDTMPEFGGRNAGPCPVELMLASLTGCIVETAIYIAKRARIELGDVRAVTIAVVAKNGQAYNLTKIETTLKVQVLSSSNKERARDCLGLLDKYCIITKLLMKAIPITISLVITNGKIKRRSNEMNS